MLKQTCSGITFLFLILIMFLFDFSVTPALGEKEFNPSGFVNPFIGTSGWGYTFPGAVVPWGMVSVSPHNTFRNPAGYSYGEKDFYGFGHVHLSGVGCNELGSIIFTISAKDNLTEPDNYKVNYSRENAQPGYYSLYLDSLKVKAEVTVSKRCGIIRFIPEKKIRLNVIADIGRSLSITGGGNVNILSSNAISGFNITGGFCGEANREKVYFHSEFSKTAAAQKIWKGNAFVSSASAEVNDSSIGTILTFDLEAGEELVVKTGISYVSVNNAKENLVKETGGRDFETIRKQAEEEWNRNLSKVYVEGGTEENFIKFYSALYHMLIHPNIISDVNGEYPLMGRGGTAAYTDRERYTVYSLWDTYRTLHPFLALVYPEKQSDMISAMIDMYKESGYLPKWELAGNETFMMVGDPATPVIADSYVKGIKDFDVKTAIEALLKPAMLEEGEVAAPVRTGYHDLLKYGYIPFEQDTTIDWWVWGPVSTNLEYNLSDWTISQMLQNYGDENLSKEFLRRSMLYKNLFDKETLFMRPRLKNGEWMEPFDPMVTEGSGNWGGSGGPGYVEGNAWNYTWFVPHDIPGLIELFGGEKEFADKLFESFNNNQFTITNEPDIAYPYLFNYIKGEEYRTRFFVQKIINENFSINPSGLPGNDDCGAISAWLVFSMLGFYPDCPASGFYQAGIPSFDKAVITLNNSYFSGEKVVIEKTGREDSNSCIITVNGQNIDDYRIKHDGITSGAKIKFHLK
jgi:predicted alpha-1,2-mannosidase